MTEAKEQTDRSKSEYSEVNNYLRHYSSLRFVMFSVFFAVMAGIISVALGIVGVKPLTATVIWTTRVGGLMTTIVFSIYEFRLERLIRYYQRAGEALEGSLGYSQMTKRPKSHFTFVATWIMYSILFLFWSVVILKA